MGQEPVLYARSVRENIGYGLEKVSENEIQQSAKMANCHNFVMDTTDGYDTDVGEKGSQMSGRSKSLICSRGHILYTLKSGYSGTSSEWLDRQ